MRESIEEYMLTVQEEINRCEKWMEEHLDKMDEPEFVSMKARAITLGEVKCDLEGRLEEEQIDRSMINSRKHVSKFDFEEEYEEI